jgi:hypothetical protein
MDRTRENAMTFAAAPCRSNALLLLVAALAPHARGQVFDYKIEGGASDSSFGAVVSRVGDVDKDGYEDFIVGAPYSGSFEGAATVYSGKSGKKIVRLTGNASTGNSQFGYDVDGRIDADGDGWNDVLIGSPGDSTGAPSGGRVLVYSPHKSMVLLDIYSNKTGAGLGASVRSLQADLDGDGIDDFIVGEAGIDAARVISGASGSNIFVLTGQSGSQFGTSVGSAGDVDGDGVADFAVGSPYYVAAGGKITGRVATFSGADGSRIWAVDGADNSSFGLSLAHPGDLDGDGRGDLVIGAPYHVDPNGHLTGCATVLSGANHSLLYKVYGDQDGDLFGQSVRSVSGDIDHDGTNDWIAGATCYISTGVGYARTISGATGTVLNTYVEHSNDPYVQSQYGSSVAGGDFDNDGVTDVLIGGSNFDGGYGIVETWTTAVASWNNYGAGWSGTLGVPAFTAQNDPVVGAPLSLDLSNSLGATTIGTLVLGIGKASIPTGKGGTLLVDPLLFIPLSIPASGLTLSGTLPNDPALYGFHLYLQALELDAGASKGISFTQGLDLYLGYP